jgi:NAD kinase
MVDRECLSEKCYAKKDAILVIGGDGTFLRTSHLNKYLPMIGINPNPEKKEGFFMQLDRYDYKKKLPILIRKLRHINYFRLKVSINGKMIPERSLNELYIGTKKPYELFNYDIIVGKKREFQRSSGIIIGTPAGSHAWIKSAGGKKMKLDETRFQYVIREPYEGKLTGRFNLKKGMISDMVTIIPKNPSILVVDSVSREYNLDEGDTVLITPAEPLRYVK